MKLLGKNVLKKISSECKQSLNRHNDDFIDLTMMTEENPEFIRHVYRIPFGVISFSDSVFIAMRKKKKRKNVYSHIFYLDGTGSAVDFSKAQK